MYPCYVDAVSLLKRIVLSSVFDTLRFKKNLRFEGKVVFAENLTKPVCLRAYAFAGQLRGGRLKMCRVMVF